MKKLSFLFILIIAGACSNEREASDLDIGNEKIQSLSKTSINDPLCLVIPQPVVLYGNQADYPKVTKSGFYSFNEPINVMSWFYVNTSLTIRKYINTKYYQGNNGGFVYSLNSYTIPNLGTYGVDYVESSNTIPSYEPQTNNQLFPGNTLTPEVSSYVVYRILSEIDRYTEYYFTTNGIALKPIGIAFNYDTTMCGDYTGLYYKVFYSLN